MFHSHSFRSIQGLILLSVISLSFISMLNGCSQDEPIPPTIVHDNSVEYYADSHRLPDGKTVVTTNQIIFYQNRIVKNYSFNDTLPDLGKETIKTADEERDTIVNKEYDIYFQMKGVKQ